MKTQKPSRNLKQADNIASQIKQENEDITQGKIKMQILSQRYGIIKQKETGKKE